MQTSTDRTLLGWLRVVRDGWYALILFVLLGVGAGFAYTATQPTSYQAVGTVVVSPANGFLDPAGADALPGVTGTVVRLAGAPDVLDLAARRYIAAADSEAEEARRRRDADVAWVRSHVSFVQDGNSSVIDVSAMAPSQEAADDLALASVESLATVVNESRAATGSSDPDPDAPTASGIVVRALEGLDEVGKASPTPQRNLLLGGSAGFLLGVVAALVMGLSRPRIRTSEELATRLEVPYLGSVKLRAGQPRTQRAFIEAAVRLREVKRGNLGAVTLVTGTVEPHVIASVASGLMQALGTSGARAALVDADLSESRKPRPWDNGSPATSGLAEILGNGTDVPAAVSDAIREYDDRGVMVLPAGRPTGSPSSLLDGDRVASALDVLSDSYDFVIVASSSLDRLDEVASLIAAVDHVVVVVAKNTPQSELNTIKVVERQVVGMLVVDGS